MHVKCKCFGHEILLICRFIDWMLLFPGSNAYICICIIYTCKEQHSSSIKIRN